MSTNRIAMLKERAEASSKLARDIAQKASDENRELTADEKHDYDGALVALKSVLEGIKTTKADEAVIAQAKEFADSVGVADGGDVRARIKSLGLTVCDSPEFKAMLGSFPEGRIPQQSRVQSAPIAVKSRRW